MAGFVKFIISKWIGRKSSEKRKKTKAVLNNMDYFWLHIIDIHINLYFISTCSMPIHQFDIMLYDEQRISNAHNIHRRARER